MNKTFVAMLLSAGLGIAAFGQSVITARAGLVHYIEGTVKLEGQALELDGIEFPEMKTGQTLAVEDGYAEVLLSPGSFLRLGQDSSFRLDSSKLTDTRLAILSGRALVEVDATRKETSLTVAVGGNEVKVVKAGLYHFDGDRGSVRVYDGKAETLVGDSAASLTKGRTLTFDATPGVEKFKTKEKDDVYFWSQSRSQLLAGANLSSAQLNQRSRLAVDSWVWNQYLNLYTFLPASGTFRSPFGWMFYSPRTIWIYYTPVSSANSGWAAENSRGPAWSGLSSSSSSGAAASVAPAADVAVRSDSGSSAPAVSSSGGGGGRR